MAGLLVWAGWHYFPNDQRKIRGLLENLAKTLSASKKSSALSELATANTLTDVLTPDLEVNLTLPDIGQQSFSGRDEVIRTAMAARKTYPGLRIEFLDILVTVNPDRQTASAELTAQASEIGDGDRDSFVQEFKVELRKDSGKWRIYRVEMLRTLNLEM